MPRKAKAPVKQPPDNSTVFQLAIVKGVIEHNDPTSYFASLGGYLTYRLRAVVRGWIALGEGDHPEVTVTPAGREVYDRCKLSELPNKHLSRAYMWKWSADNNPD